MLTFDSLYFLQVRFFFLSSLLLSRRSRISAVTQVLFFWRCLPRISLAVSGTVVLKVVIIESVSVTSLLMMVRGANFPPIIAWKISSTFGSFSFSRSNLSFVCDFFFFFFSGEGGRLSSASRDHFQMSAPGKVRVLAMFTPDRKHFLTKM